MGQFIFPEIIIFIIWRVQPCEHGAFIYKIEDSVSNALLRLFRQDGTATALAPSRCFRLIFGNYIISNKIYTQQNIYPTKFAIRINDYNLWLNNLCAITLTPAGSRERKRPISWLWQFSNTMTLTTLQAPGTPRLHRVGGLFPSHDRVIGHDGPCRDSAWMALWVPNLSLTY